ncbi:MAG: hypothetical protein LBF15_06860 [Candidatus Peribacteria bacterium]|jgi:hypothetical protein|nr:hypothetical protein [Candidatus Peribacteria bacterium]
MIGEGVDGGVGEVTTSSGSGITGVLSVSTIIGEVVTGGVGGFSKNSVVGGITISQVQAQVAVEEIPVFPFPISFAISTNL